MHANPADHALEVFNTDFISDRTQRESHIDELAGRWLSYAHANGLAPLEKDEHETLADRSGTTQHLTRRRKGFRAVVTRDAHRTWILMERNVINYSRNLLAYGVRIGMYRTSPPRSSSIPVLTVRSWHGCHARYDLGQSLPDVCEGGECCRFVV